MEDRQEIKKDEVGSMEEVFGKDDSMFHEAPPIPGAEVPVEGENTVTENMKDNAPVDLTDTQEKDIPEEYEITHMKNVETGHVFPVNDTIRQRKFLYPCTAEGKLLPDLRRPSELR